MSRRAQRVAAQLTRDVGEILRSKVDDPDLGFITITRAYITADLRHARLMWAVLGGDDQVSRSQAALARASNHIRRELGFVIGLRYTPALEFEMDAAYFDGSAVLNTLTDLDVEPRGPSTETDR
ncbi:MAG: 30S ribosome-binding factor RbfA [Chloroflexi bacterium]|nr:30S ribosome-binding factor RbfA [Chloroflexota bacterium]MCY3937779.1 30S ribosome-binding factor RbfA [Chloroflexota bacterium]